MKRQWILHPFLLAIYPALFLFAANMEQFGISVVFKPAARTLAWTVVGWVALSLVLRNRRKAALITSLFLVLYFSYGHIVNALPFVSFFVGSTRIRTAQLVLAGSIAAFGAGAYFAVRAKSDLSKFTAVANVMAVVLVGISVAKVAFYEVRNYAAGNVEGIAQEGQAAAAAAKTGPRPNIFYIILDGYGRADDLKALYGYDNQPFIDFLRSKDFYVASHARSNYSHTRQSLASSLNMKYLDDLAMAAGVYSSKSEPATLMIRRNQVRLFMKAIGYRFVAFATGANSTEMPDADLYLKPAGQRSEFEQGVAGTTPALSDDQKAADDRRRILYTLETLPTLARTGAPSFVFAHIIAPHPPYVFDADGQPADIKYYGSNSASHLVAPGRLTRAESMKYYIGQLEFITARIRPVIETLLADSPVPPIIVLQGDHGPCCFLHHQDIERTYLQDRFSILSAYYLPGGGEAGLYDTITPVNTFRVIFDYYFGAGYKPLPDRSFYSPANHPYRFTEVTGEIDSPADRARYEALKNTDYYDILPAK
jgi:hypothetical protein